MVTIIKPVSQKLSDDPVIMGSEAIQKLLSEYYFETVLDIGCGEGIHSEIFLQNGKQVTGIDYGRSCYFEKNSGKFNSVIADFNTYEFGLEYDCVWCSHVLEHQININAFLKKVFSVLKEGGILALTVPPMKSVIVGGHVSLWNAGLLMYNLVLAGFNCRNAKVKTYGYNISLIVEKETIPELPQLHFDAGDIKLLSDYLPGNLAYMETDLDTPFEGNIVELNWDERSAI